MIVSPLTIRSLVIAGGLCVAAVPWLCGELETRTRFASVRKQISQLDDEQYLQFEQNLAAYRRLPQNELSRLRQLHDKFAHDEELMATASEFQTWLATVGTADHDYYNVQIRLV